MFVASATGLGCRRDDESMRGHRRGGATPKTGASRRRPSGGGGGAGDLFVAPRRRCPRIASSSLLDLTSQSPLRKHHRFYGPEHLGSFSKELRSHELLAGIFFGGHPTVVGGVQGKAGQATVACLPQSRDRQEAAGHVTIEPSTRCTCLLQSPNCRKLLHRRQNSHPAFPPLPDGRGSVGAGWDVMHASSDVGNTTVRTQTRTQMTTRARYIELGLYFPGWGPPPTIRFSSMVCEQE